MTERKFDWDGFDSRRYESTAFDEKEWISTARALYESARKLEPDLIRVWEKWREVFKGRAHRHPSNPCQGAYYMLLSFAVENLLKAAAISKNGEQYREQFRTKARFPKALTKHDLVQLAQKVGLVLKDGEEDLLRRLKRSAVWHGRYPVPLDLADMRGEEEFLDGKKRLISWFGQSDVERLNTFVIGLPARLGLDERCWKGAA